MEKRTTILFFALSLLAGAAVAVLVAEACGGREREARARAFHQVTGGLGFGPAVDLSSCAFGLDPRLDGTCSEDFGPLPGGEPFCRRHSGSIFPYPRLKPVGNTLRGVPPGQRDSAAAGK